MTAHASTRSRPRWIAAAALAALVAGTAIVHAPSAVAALPDDADLLVVSESPTGDATTPFLTSDGQKAAFVSAAADLVSGDANGVADVFLATAAPGSGDPFAGAPVLISSPDASLAHVSADGRSLEPVASMDGRYVAFTSHATNLVAGGGNATGPQVYVRDTVLRKTFRLQNGDAPNGASGDADMSDDGRYVVFTSEASNLTPGDANDAPDVMIADLDADADGVRGDVSVSRLLPQLSIPGGTAQAVISGNGHRIAFVSGVAGLDPAVAPGVDDGSYLYRILRTGGKPVLVQPTAHDPSIDATGEVIAYVADTQCTGYPAIMASTFGAVDRVYSISLGTAEVMTGRGYVTAPTVSADGGLVAWATTQPRSVSMNGGVPPVEYPAPVIRTQAPVWFDARLGFRCDGPHGDSWQDLTPGLTPSLSATGRTIAFSAPSGPEPEASSSIFAVDTQTNDGLSVTSTQGALGANSFMAVVPISAISTAALTGYAADLASAPIHNLPIHNLPIHNLPIHNLPIHNLPIHNLPIHNLPIHNLPIHNLPIHNLPAAGGWPAVLAGSPFADQPPQSVILSTVLTWAADILQRGNATAAQLDAANRIRALTLSNVDIDGTGIDALSLGSFVLGRAPLAEVPLPGGAPGIAAWQAEASAQGLTTAVTGDTVLADLDYGGLDVGRTGIDAVTLRDLPVDATLLGDILLNELFLEGTPLGDLDVSKIDPSTRDVIFTGEPTGSLVGSVGSIQPSATVAQFAKGAPATVTLGTLLFSLLDAQSYPWEQIEPTAIDPRIALRESPGDGCNAQLRCERKVEFRFAFDPAPGEAADYSAATATVRLPPTTRPTQLFAAGSSPTTAWNDVAEYAGPTRRDGSLVTIPLGDAAPGTVIQLDTWYSGTMYPGQVGDAEASLTAGDLTTGSSVMEQWGGLEIFDDPTHNIVDGEWDRTPDVLQEGYLYYEWIAPLYVPGSPEIPPAPAADEDYYLVKAPGPGRRLVISTNAADGQISLALYGTSTNGNPLGTTSAGAAPGTAVAETARGTEGAPAPSGADSAAALPGRTLIDQAVVSGDGAAEIVAASTDAAPGEELLVRVTSGNGEPSSALYSLRARYIDEAAETTCASWQPTGTGVVGVSDAVTAETNTIYVFDQERYGERYGAQAAADVRDALASMNGTGHVGGVGVQGAVLSIDSSAAVQAARGTLDDNPCSMSARRALTAAINAFVADAVEGERSHISSVVLVGADDVIPFAPVAQNTADFTEDSHAASLRLTKAADGSDCPASVSIGEVDTCATPLSAAAAGNWILTDDPYGFADAFETLGGYLYVPTVALGRLIDSPGQILGAISRFVDDDGTVDARSTLTGGYGAWSELPDDVEEKLDWRTAGDDTQLGDAWNAAAVEAALFPEGGRTAGVVSINTHADEMRMLPRVPNAETGTFVQDELYVASQRADSGSLRGALVFTIGCHAAGNLPSGYYGDAAVDWTDVFSAAAGYVGNTGYGLANNLSTALSERLLVLYADWLGVTNDDGTTMSAAGALTFAKQSYKGDLGKYSGFDEKVMMQAVYYGLPMYALDDEGLDPKAAPFVPRANDLTPVRLKDGLVSASLVLAPSFDERSGEDAAGRPVTYLTANGQDPLVIPGQPVLPRVTSRLDAAPDGMVARGALISELESDIGEVGRPAIAEPTVGIDEPGVDRSDVAFPSSFADLTRQETPEGTVDLLVVTPARVVSARGGSGNTESFTRLGIDVVYGAAGLDDSTAPNISSIQARETFSARVDGTGTSVQRVLLLAQPENETAWRPIPLALANGTWQASLDFTGPYRWILQAVDTAGNVATDSARGRIEVVAPARPPTLGPAGPDAVADPGQRVLRTIDVEIGPDAKPTGTYRVLTPGGQTMSTGRIPVVDGADGKTRAMADLVAPTPGAYEVEVEVCANEACARTRFALTVNAVNAPPAAKVDLLSSDDPVVPSSTLTAVATGSDPDDDDVALAYRWTQNGLPLSETGTSLALDGIARPGDLFEVVVTPADATGPGNVASARVIVAEPPPLPLSPTITATATTAHGEYPQGTWSRKAVTVRFACTGFELVSCSAPVTLRADTVAAGATVQGVVRDGLGRTATVGFVVKIDRTAPKLMPVVTPNPVVKGTTATATANATDSGSGIAAQGCTAPDTSTAGSKKVECSARDHAGNTARAHAAYVVTAPTPAAPVITATAKAGHARYVQGTWSRVPVTVSFTCTSGVKVTACPSSRTVSADTGPGGRVVVGTMKDKLGRTAEVRFTVKVDRTAPKLAPTATPSTVRVGGKVVLAPNAKDAGSGVVSQSCGAPDTTKKGVKTASCTATDAAGNTAKATVKYTVQAPAPTPPPQPPTCKGGADRTPLEVVNADGSSVFLKTSGVPILFRACDAHGKPIGTKGFVKSVTQTAVTDLAKTAKLTELWYPPFSTFTYAKAAGVWVGAIPTAKLSSGKKYTYRVLLADETSFTLTFGVR